jgi:hypothetical protein
VMKIGPGAPVQAASVNGGPPAAQTTGK